MREKWGGGGEGRGREKREEKWGEKEAGRGEGEGERKIPFWHPGQEPGTTEPLPKRRCSLRAESVFPNFIKEVR